MNTQTRIITIVLVLLLLLVETVSVAQTAGAAGVQNSNDPGIVFWLKAGEGVTTLGGTVTEWIDQTESNIGDATPSSSTEGPTISAGAINGFDALSFDGTDDHLEIADNARINDGTQDAISAFFVFRTPAVVDDGGYELIYEQGGTVNGINVYLDKTGTGEIVVQIYEDDSGLREYYASWAASPSTVYIASFVYDGSSESISFYQNNTQQTLQGTFLSPIDRFTDINSHTGDIGIGAFNDNTQYVGDQERSTGGDYFNGDIAEIIYYNTALNEAEHSIIVNYLGEKYGVGLSSSDLYAETAYNNEVIGIGQTAGVNHTASTGNGGGLYLADNGSSLADGEWLLAGHNGQTHQVTNNSAPSGFGRWNRSWYLEKTGTVDAKIVFNTTEAGFGAADLNGRTIADYDLLYRSTTSSTFAGVTTATASLTDDDGDGFADVVFTVSDANLADGYYTLRVPELIQWYTYRSGDWDEWQNWTLDPSGTLRLNPANEFPDDINDEVHILNGDQIDLDTDAVTANGGNPYQIASLDIENGGVLDLTNTTGHNFTVITGEGRIRLDGDNFPAGNTTGANGFATADGGTLEFYGTADYSLSTASTFNNIWVNMSGVTLTLLSDYTLNGDLEVQSGTLRFNDNSSTTRLIMSVAGDAIIDGGASITVGTGDAVFDDGDGIFQFHQFEIDGDFTNNGSAIFHNLSGTTITNGNFRDAYPTASDSDNSSLIPAVEFGVVEVLFNNSSANQLVTLNSVTEFYRIEVNKGTSQTYSCEINASNIDNFKLYGRIAFRQDDEVTGTPNIENPRALGLEGGTLILGDNIRIEEISKFDDPGSEAGRTGNRNYIIDSDAQLWLSSNSYIIRENDYGIHIFGKLRISDDATLTYGTVNSNEQKTVFVDDAGVYEQNGGLCEITQFRNKTGGGGDPRGAFIMTGGTMNVGGGNVDGSHAIFSLPWPENVFSMTAEDPANPPVINLNLTNGAKDDDSDASDPDAAIQLGSSEGNYTVEAGTFNIDIVNNGTDYKISSTVPFYNLNITRNGTNGNTREIILDEIVAATNGASPAANALPLVILNDLQILDGTNGNIRFDANDQNVFVDNIFVLGTDAEYDPGTNTTHFNGNTAIQNITINGTLVGGGFHDVVMEGASTKRLFGATSFVVQNDLTVNSGTLDVNDRTVEVQGNITNCSSIIDESVAGTGSILLTNGTTAHTISGDGSGEFDNLEIDEAGAVTTTFTANQTINGTLTLTNGVLDIDTYRLTMQGANATISDGGSGFDNTRMIATAGNASDGGLEMYVDADETITFPIGTDANSITRYTPVEATFSNFSDDGYIVVNPADRVLETTGGSDDVLSYYWKVGHREFTSVPTVTYQYYYDQSDLDGSTNENSFVPGKVLNEGSFTRSYEDDAVPEDEFVDDINNIITFNGGSDTGFAVENADYTAGINTRFAGSPQVFYNTNTGRGDWDEGTKWTTNSDGTDDGVNDYPQVGDIAVIQNYGQGNQNAWVNGNIDITVARLVFDNSNGGWSPRLWMTRRTAILNLGVVEGAGTIYLEVTATEVPTFTGTTDLGLFSSNSGSEFNFKIDADNQTVDMPSNIDTYPNIRIEAGNGGNDDDNRILQTSVPITVNGYVRMDRSSRFRINHDVIIEGDLRVTWQQNRCTFEIGDEREVTITVGGNLRLENGQGNDDSRIVVKNDNQNGYEHTLEVLGDIEIENVNAASSVFDLYNGASPSNNAVLKLANTGTHSFTNASTILPEFYRIVMDKGADQSSSFTISSDFTANSGADGLEKSVELLNGTLILNNSDIDIVLNEDTTNVADNADFQIPATAGLEVQAGVVRVTATGTGAGNGVLLNGRLAATGPNAEIILNGGAGADNYVEYGGSGDATLEVSDGLLLVGSQVRQNLLSESGILNYNQTGGTAVFGVNAAPENSKGVLEVVNTGSFTLTGTSTFALVRAQTAPETGSFILGPDIATNIGSSNAIDFGYDGTLGSDNIVVATPASTTFDLNIAPDIPSIRVDNGDNGATARAVIRPLTLSNDLSILNTGTFNANGLALNIGGNLVNDATFTANGNTTTFNGTVQQVSGTANTTFYNLITEATTSLTLNQAITVENDLEINSGQLDDNGNEILLQGDLSIVTEHVGTGGIVMRNTVPQIIDLPDLGASISTLEIDNPGGVTLPLYGGSEVTLRITDQLTLNSILDIDNNRLVLEPGLTLPVPAGGFSKDRMISCNASLISNGVEKEFTNVGLSSFVIPIGTPGKYTPTTLNVSTSESGTHSVLVKPIGQAHPSTSDGAADGTTNGSNDVLQYYWRVTTNTADGNNTLDGFNGSIIFQYPQEDVVGTESSYGGARLNGLDWTKFNSGTGVVNTSANTITFTQAELGSGTADSFDGEYTAGDLDDIPNELPTYISNVTTGNWNTAASWILDDNGNGTIDGGETMTEVPEPGSRVIVQSGHTITADINDIIIYATEIQGTMDVATTDGHNFGIVTGSGMLRTEQQVLPGGDFDQFFTLADGGIEFAGATSYNISSDFASARELIISGGGVKSLPAVNYTIGNSGIQISDNSTLTNANNISITVNGPVDIANGTLNVGNASAILSATDITLTTGTYDANGSNVSVSGALNMNGGTFNAGSGNLRVGGDLTLTGSVFNNEGSTFTFNGGSNQTIDGDFSTSTFNNITLNKSGGQLVLAANANVYIDNILNLGANRINTQASNAVLRITNGSSSIRTSGFVNGPLEVNLANGDDYTFPTGKGATYKEISINGISQTGSQIWTAEYFNTGALAHSSAENSVENYDRETYMDPQEQVVNVNSGEYWAIDGPTATVSSIVLDASNTEITQTEINDQALQVMQWDELNSYWIHLGGNSSGTAPSSVSVTTDASAVSRTISFSEKLFTHGSEDPASPLPVEFLSFEVTAKDRQVELIWKTATETNNELFEVQRSEDGKIWDIIGTVAGAGNSTEVLTYEYTDKNPIIGTSYYRLRQIDFDGRYDYSKIRSVEVEAYSALNTSVVDIAIFPNPSREVFTLNVTGLTPQTVAVVKLLDVYGKVHEVTTVTSEELARGLKLNTGDQLPAGLYFVNIRQGNISLQRKLIIQ